MFRTIVILVSTILAVSPGFADDLRKSERTCRLVFPEMPSGFPRFVHLFDGKDNHRVYLSAVNFSEVVKLRPGDITLVMAPEPISDPENIPSGYPRLSVGEGVRNFYLFLSPDRDNKSMPLRMNLINLDEGKFKIGNTLWYNFTNHLVQARLGKSKLSVGARKFAISEAPLPKSGYYRAEFIFQPQSTGNFRRITEQQWWFDENCRYVGFVVDRGGRLPKIYFFRDFRSKIEAEDDGGDE
ncbi:hypothetical protein [Haloferula sp. A504]|uniref:hypothetical protein n=1 Tax=Haloferula sp. A504 TaxID=3373601 RepID=UPI0031CB428C|nr:hypothetical protein [Verrucomicrobiaceae bacterium E54]